MSLTKLTSVAAAAICLCSISARAADGDLPSWSVSGFGTVGAVHSSEGEADFVGGLAKPTGAGITKATSLDPDTLLGIQLGAKFTPNLSAVLQLVSQQNYANSYRPAIEWANVKYQITPSLSARVGRIALASSLVSETRFVGYANPWVRPPQEVYGVMPVSSNDGVDATYSTHLGDAVNDFQAFYGKTSIKLARATTEAKANPTWGFNNSLSMGSTTVRVGYIKATIDLDSPGFASLVDGFTSFGNAASAIPVAPVQAAGAQSLAIANKYKLTGIPITVASVGVLHDPGQWFVMAEYSKFSGEGILTDKYAWHVTGGYRVGKWTPYVTLAELKAQNGSDAGISTAGLPPPLAAPAAALTGALNATLASTAATQKTAAIGLRWDFMKNFAAKVQYDRTKLGENSSGRLTNTSPSFVPGGSFSLISATVDFVY